MVSESFPRRSARTQGFTLGEPRNTTPCPATNVVLFLRSAGPTERRNALWALDLDTGHERLLVDPTHLLTDGHVSPAEQARRERARERATGITGYATDADGTIAVFALSGKLFRTDIASSTTHLVVDGSDVADPRPAPDGQRIAYLSGGRLRVTTLDGSEDRAVSPDDGATWGHAEFIAAEEMRRARGYWWSPDSTTVLTARVDQRPVDRWFLADPTDPATPPREMRYPAAGTANADVRLAVLRPDEPDHEPSGVDRTDEQCPQRTDVRWDLWNLPYLVSAHWSENGPPLVTVQSRDQRTQVVLALDPHTGETRELHRDEDPHWIEIKPGWPAWTPSGQLVRVSADAGAYRLVVDGQPWTTAPLQVRQVLDVAEDVLIAASANDPTQVHLYRVTASGPERITTRTGVHSGARRGDFLVTATRTLDQAHTELHVHRGSEHIAELDNQAQEHGLDLRVELLCRTERALRSALLLPAGYRPEHGSLPVLVDPYGGPQAQRVLAQQQGYLTSQWFADQGFAVLITDGRGMTGRSPEWDRAVAGDLAGPPLTDQIDALHAAAETHPELDLTRVGIRGWSFGGYLAALGVLRRPDVFHTAIVGAGVVDWRLYDTHYTERYLGDPNEHPEVYEQNSLLNEADHLTRPMLIVHGTVDDNVVFAHGLRLSRALTEAGKPHTMLPLPGVTHMPTDESTSENLLLLQVDFLRNSLGVDNGHTWW